MDKMKYNPFTGYFDYVGDTETSVDIDIDGGPLASAVDLSKWPEAWHRDDVPVIPAGVDLETALLELFSALKTAELQWIVTRWSPQLVPPMVNYTPIVECHGGQWMVHNFRNASVDGNIRQATLQAPYGYYLTEDSPWTKAPLTVQVAGDARIGYVHKVNGNTVNQAQQVAGGGIIFSGTKSVGQVLDFSDGFAFSIETTMTPSIGPLFHPLIYAATNRKTIDLSSSVTLNETGLSGTSNTISKMYRIYASYYYYAGVIDGLPQSSEEILGSFAKLPTKGFVHSVQEGAYGITVSLPEELTLDPITVPSRKVLVVAVPPTHSLAKTSVEPFLIDDAEYILPDGTSVTYTVYQFSNEESEDISFEDITLMLK